jgi:polyisoprenoid-binding protein YceI
MKRTSLLLATLAAALFSASAAETYTIDTAHAEIGFSIRHLGLSKVKGKFDKFTGSLTVDGSSLTGAQASIEATSVNTAHKDRDDHLRNEDFFNVGKHAAITFKATKVDATTITGDLTLLGKTQPVTLAYTLTGPIDHPQVKGGKKVGLEATGKINRFDFGMDWNKMPGALGKEVEISINLEADKT